MLKNHKFFCSTTEVVLLAPAPAVSLVSQARPTSTKGEGSGELCIQAVSHCTVQCGTITLQYHMTHYMTVRAVLKIVKES